MKNKKVIVAVSGGVDSSTAAALLKKNGYDVVGVFMRMHEHSNAKDARKMAKILNIPFYILDVRREFKKRVIDYSIGEHKKGNTPNPCIECNKYIKFKFLFAQLNKLKADYIATGHYARVGGGKLLTAKDIKKDQSYFLWTLKQKQLKKILFPIGDYTKTEVREMAKKFELPVFEKKDSQDICFTLPRRSLKAEAGLILTIDNKKVGEHKGLIFYTIGQRKGIEIGGTGPFYVVKKDFKNNALVVSNSEKDLLQKEMMVENMNWISSQPFSGKCKVKIRSMAPMVLATILKTKNSKLKIYFDKPQRAITPGQSAVFYAPAVASAKEGKGNELLGGGVIHPVK